MSGYYPPPGAPPQQSGYPQQPPMGGQGWGQQQFGGPPGQYQQPPPQQQQQQWMPPPGPPPQQGYGQTPPHMQQNFQQPPPPHMQQNFQQPPPPQGFQQPPPHGMHQQQPPPGMQQPMMPPAQQASMPSPGYGNDVAQGNATPDAQALAKAMSGLRKDHSTVIRILTSTGPREMALLRQTFERLNKGQTIESRIKAPSFTGDYAEILTELVRGPLLSDVYNVKSAIKGAGTNEDMLDDVLIGRSNADMRAIKSMYQKTFNKTMESDVEGDLSLKTKTMYQLIMRASRTEESYPYNPVEIGRDVESLHFATSTPAITTNQEAVYTVLTQRSDNQIRAIATDFEIKYKRTLEDSISKNFSGHMKDALLLCLGRAVDRTRMDAKALNATMEGLGTKDTLLINRVVAIHWDRERKDQVKRAYPVVVKKELLPQVRSETSGDYRDTLIACLT